MVDFLAAFVCAVLRLSGHLPPASQSLAHDGSPLTCLPTSPHSLQVVSTALPECKNPEQVSVAVKAFMQADLQVGLWCPGAGPADGLWVPAACQPSPKSRAAGWR